MIPSQPLFPRDIFLWLGAKFFSNLGRNMLFVAVTWRIYKLTGDALALGAIGLAEAVPFLAVSLWAGHIVDKHEKKPVILTAQGLLLLCAGVLAAATFLLKTPLVLLYSVIAVAGAGISFESVASGVYLQTLIPRENFSRAAAWNLATFTTAAIAGPALGGWILSRGTERTVYFLAILFFAAAMALAAGLCFRPPAEDSPTESGWERVKEGVRFVRAHRLIFACMSLDMVAVLFGDVVALYPIFADRLNAGPLGFGILRASPAMGSAAVSLLHAWRPFVKPTWENLKKAVTIFGLAVIAFGLSKHIAWAAIFLMINGAADGVSVIIRQSVYQANTPDGLRGRVAALGGIFISASNEIGAFESGLAARLMGVVPSVIFGGSVTLLSVLGAGRIFGDLEKKEKTAAV